MIREKKVKYGGPTSLQSVHHAGIHPITNLEKTNTRPIYISYNVRCGNNNNNYFRRYYARDPLIQSPKLSDRTSARFKMFIHSDNNITAL